MYEVLGRVTLSTGDAMEVGVAIAPEPAWRERIPPLLEHKGPVALWLMDRVLCEPLDGLQARFYVGVCDAQLIAHILIIGADGAGIVAHVFTLPEYRQRGAGRAVLAHQMADMPRAGFSVLGLNAILGHPYRMYESVGFRGIVPGAGMMRWEAAPGAVDALVGRPVGHVREVRWDDYGMLHLLASLPLGEDEELPRSPLLGVKGIAQVEGSFPHVQHSRYLGGEKAGITWLILAAAAPRDTALGWALLYPDQFWFRDAFMLDLYVRPGYGDLFDGYQRLLAALPDDACRVRCLSAGSGPRAAALQQAGFRHAATLRDWLRSADGRRDVQLFVRE
jgi:hypothetical protein